MASLNRENTTVGLKEKMSLYRLVQVYLYMYRFDSINCESISLLREGTNLMLFIGILEHLSLIHNTIFLSKKLSYDLAESHVFQHKNSYMYLVISTHYNWIFYGHVGSDIVEFIWDVIQGNISYTMCQMCKITVKRYNECWQYQI